MEQHTCPASEQENKLLPVHHSQQKHKNTQFKIQNDEITIKSRRFSLLVLSLATTSCRSAESSISDNTTTTNSVYNVQVNLAGIESEEETPIFQASAGKNIVATTSPQQTKIPLGDDSFVMATLTPQSNTSSLSSQAQASVNPRAATPPTELGTGIRYKVAVYDNNGNYVTEKNLFIKMEKLMVSC